jgi:oligopeptide transport system substrate-binding protein
VVPASLTQGRRTPLGWPALLVVILGAILAGSLLGAAPGRAAGEARIAVGEPATLDPAAAGDAGSAAFIAQLYESLTAFDPALELRPALAERWDVSEDGRRVTFVLRPDLAFSDGTPLGAADVVRSWLRVVDPTSPSPLASLMDDVVGVEAYRRGTGDASSVGLRAVDELRVEVDLVRPTGDFPSIVSGPTFGIVPAGFDGTGDPTRGPVSGGYRIEGIAVDGYDLIANPRYWAGAPALGRIRLVTDLDGKSPVEAFEDGELDYTPISVFDASWIRYDPGLGPQLREVPSLAVSYLGFDTSRPPFDDVRVRRAFGQAVDWRRIVELASDGTTIPATSMVPPGIPGRSERDFLPVHDPEGARELLAEAGYPDGADFPVVTMVTAVGHDDAVATQIREELGIEVAVEAMDFGTYTARLDSDPPAIWGLGWVADYPGRNDFLGILLGTGRTSNYGRWSSTDLDDAIGMALEASDPAAAEAAFDEAEAIVQRDVPVVPLEYSTSWALSREGLLGAGQNGLSIIRMAGLAWR